MDRKEAIRILERGATIPGDDVTWEQVCEAVAYLVSDVRRCEGCRWENRHQKCTCCCRNFLNLKDCYEGDRND